MSARMFDALGLCSGFTILLKMILQKLWKLKIEWDDVLPSDINESFQKIIIQLPLLEKITIPRAFAPDSNYKIVQLAAFCDASKDGYSANVYVISENAVSGERVSALAFAKARVTPISKMRQKINESTLYGFFWTLEYLFITSLSCLSD